MATLAIGDIHGQYLQFTQLLSNAKFNHKLDQLILVGDLIGRGPNSAEVLDAIMQMQDHAKVVLGNHDLHFLHQYYAQANRDPKLEKLLNHKQAGEFANFLRQQELAIALSEINTLVVHAGVFYTWDLTQTMAYAKEVSAALCAENYEQNIKAMYGDNGCLWEDKLSGALRLQTLVNIFTRIRCVNIDGSISWFYRGLPAEDIPPGTCPWFDYPLRKMKDITIVCGHWSSLGLFMRKDLAMIDTGCCFGGPLTGLWLEDKKLVFAN